MPTIFPFCLAENKSHFGAFIYFLFHLFPLILVAQGPNSQFSFMGFPQVLKCCRNISLFSAWKVTVMNPTFQNILNKKYTLKLQTQWDVQINLAAINVNFVLKAITPLGFFSFICCFDNREQVVSCCKVWSFNFEMWFNTGTGICVQFTCIHTTVIRHIRRMYLQGLTHPYKDATTYYYTFSSKTLLRLLKQEHVYIMCIWIYSIGL